MGRRIQQERSSQKGTTTVEKNLLHLNSSSNVLGMIKLLLAWTLQLCNLAWARLLLGKVKQDFAKSCKLRNFGTQKLSCLHFYILNKELFFHFNFDSQCFLHAPNFSYQCHTASRSDHPLTHRSAIIQKLETY